MTEPTDIEALIEEAAKAINNVRWSHVLPHSTSMGGPNWTDRDLARAAFAVFEKAHAPTDHERSVLLDELEAWQRHTGDAALGNLLRRVGSAIRRSEAHAPTDDEREALINDDTDDAWQAIADALGNLGYSLNSHEDTAEWVLRYLFRRSEVPHEHVWQNRVSGGSKCTECDLWQDKRVEPQGEPTDIDVLIADLGEVAGSPYTLPGNADVIEAGIRALESTTAELHDAKREELGSYLQAIRALATTRADLARAREVIEKAEDWVTAHYLDTSMGEKVLEILATYDQSN